jgi:GntR family transcriptional repressor for pyruvate dehydrogenase complex
MGRVPRSAVTARKKYEEIAEHLELLIFSGKLSSGDKFPSERDLMAQFGAGRSSVREALFALQRKGLLTVRPGAAARVSRPNADTMISELSGAVRHLLARPEGIRDLQSARALFEIGLARRAALHASDEDIAALGRALEDNRRAADQETFSHTDMMFHYTLAMISHNEVFTSLNMALTEWLAEQRNVSARAGATFEEVYLQHKAIYDAIAAREPVAAQEAMQAHLDTVAERYWREVTRGGGNDGTSVPADGAGRTTEPPG